MKQFNLSLLAVLAFAFATQSAMALTATPGVPLPAQVEAQLNSNAVQSPLYKLGSQVTQKKVNVMKAVYDFAVLGGASGSSKVLKDAAGGNAVLPKGAIVKQVITDTVTALAGSGSPTVALGVMAESSNDLKAALAAASWSGIQAGVPVGTAATSVKVTDTARAATIQINTNDLTAGKINVFIEYYLSE